MTRHLEIAIAALVDAEHVPNRHAVITTLERLLERSIAMRQLNDDQEDDFPFPNEVV